MKQLKIGLIGLGRIGKVHLENLAYRIPAAKVCAVSDPAPATHDFARNLGVPAVLEDAEEVVYKAEVEAIVICSPTATHFAYIEAAAKAGKHIFCEKPLEMTVAKIEQIKKIAETHGVKLQVGFNRRFDANFSKVQSLVRAGKIGEPHLLKITSRDPAPPPMEYIKGSGGLFMDMTIHDFDMARFIVGSEVKEVFAKGGVLVDPAIGAAGDIDTAMITLTFENGCLGVIDNSRKSAYGYDQRLEIFGSKGMSRIDNNFPDKQTLYDDQGRHAALPLHFFMERYTEAYCNEMRAFIHAVKENQAVPVDSHDALMATKIALAAKQSVAKNKPVKI